jgi:hypothetical protein
MALAAWFCGVAFESPRPLALAAVAGAATAGGTSSSAIGTSNIRQAGPSAYDVKISDSVGDMLRDGRRTFRFDTFADEIFWGQTLGLHQAIAGSKNGGVGAGISPATALSLGLKVDFTMLPTSVQSQLKQHKINLNDPASTLALLKYDAVVGLRAHFNSTGHIDNVGITCALCHSTVDNSVSPGIGARQDGWANRDLNVGAITASAPNLKPVAALLQTSVSNVKKALLAWGPGKFDAELFLDGKAFRPDGKTAATLIPSAFGLAGVNLHTYTGWGSVTYWNAFVANLEMHGRGTFFDPRLDDAGKFPVAARNKFGHLRVDEDEDRITPNLASLHFYQLALPAPRPPSNSFDHAASARGDVLFEGRAKCATCHVPPLYTEPGWNMHTPAEVGIDDFQAKRSPDERYRTTPLKGIWTRTKGGFYHDGRFPTLAAVVAHYNNFMHLKLSASEQRDLVEYMKSLGGDADDTQ